MENTRWFGRFGVGAAVMLVLALLGLHAVAAEIHLTSGEIIRGKVLTVGEDSITVRTNYSTFSVAVEDIEEIIYEKPPSEPERKEQEREQDEERERRRATYRRRSDWYVPFSYSNTGFWSIGLGHRGGIATDAYREIELDYGRWETTGWTYEYVLLPVSAVYGKNIGLAAPWWKVLAGLGGRIAVGLQAWSDDRQTYSQFVVIPSALAVVKLPLLWVEGSVSYTGGQAQYGVRLQASFGELFSALSGSPE